MRHNVILCPAQIAQPLGQGPYQWETREDGQSFYGGAWLNGISRALRHAAADRAFDSVRLEGEGR